jgi:O-antigen/teichoic acid export membrane protein
MAGMIGVVLLNKFSALQNDRESLQILRKVFLVMLIFDFVCIAGMAAIGLPVIRFCMECNTRKPGMPLCF